MSFFVSTITPEQQQQYAQGMSNARTNLLGQQAKNQFQQGQLGQRFGEDVYDFEEQANRVREDLPRQFVQAGTYHSGIFRDALKRYAIDRLTGQRNLQRGYQDAANQGVMSGRSAEDDYTNTMANLFGSQYAAQASIASALKGIL